MKNLSLYRDVLKASFLSGLFLSQASGQSTFNFSGGSLNGGGIGTVHPGPIDPSTGITPSITTVDILGYGDPAGTTITRESANPGSHITRISSAALSLNSGDGPNTGANSENNNINPGEGWEFSFDTDVELVEITFESWDETAPGEMTLSSTAFASNLIIVSADLTTDGSDSYAFPAPVSVPANTPILLQMTSDTTAGNEAGVRLEFLTVNTVAPVSAGNDLDWIGGATGNWNLTDMNFSDMGTPTAFATDDHVTVSSATTIAVDTGGITAGDVIADQAAPDVVTLVDGNLSSTSLSSTGTGVLQIGNTVDTGITTLSSGSLEILSGGSLTANALILSGDSTLAVDATGTLIINSDSFLEIGGSTINTDTDILLNNLANNIPANVLTKTGTGILTLADGAGTQGNSSTDGGAVLLNILEGSVRVSNTAQVNLGGGPESLDPLIVTSPAALTLDGELLLDGPIVMLHYAQLSGTGSIVVESESSLESRFNFGPVTIDVPILLNQDLNLDTPNNNSEMTVNGVISGSSNLTKIGNGNAILTGVNSYNGDTSVEAGNLQLTTASLVDTFNVNINATGEINLSHGQGDTITRLFIDGTEMPPGTYGSSDAATTVDFVRDDLLEGSGWLIVTEGSALAGYPLWAQSFGLTGGFDDDDDNDGITNGAEYTFGLIPNDSSSNCPFSPIDKDTGVFTYTRRDVLETGLTYAVDYTTTLQATDWIDFTADATIVSDEQTPVETVTVTIPAAILTNDKLFVRVVGFE